MLTINRRPGEAFTLQTSDGPIRIIYRCHRRGGAHISIEAPQSVKVLRDELLNQPERREVER